MADPHMPHHCGSFGVLFLSSLKFQNAANDIGIGIIQPPLQDHPAFDGFGWTWAEHSFGGDSLVFFLIILARYFLAAGGCWYLVRVCRSRVKSASSDLQNRRIRDGIHHDIRLSVLSAAVFALAAAAVLGLQAHGMTRLYADVEPNTWWYLGVSYLTVLILQDAAFYFTHRLFHHPVLYALFHRGHHRSRRPTPWTSFAFDPPEALVQSLFLVLVVMLIPLHLITLLAVLSTMTVWAIVNHLDLEYLPRRFPHHWLGRWVIGPAHHALHHHRPSVHFWLYFTFWDQVCNTHDAGYSTGLNASATTT
ncbi:sterol desaturase family protein [Synechococcus sp. 8F6]|uniref:sterol desaturase family protein n=1 Tax=Synechococcus sp. 8F6 TaxID=2025606 RepID=UPI001E562F08|nr:sterol desaturase family protein [Synechococcus sp. 8F6]